MISKCLYNLFLAIERSCRICLVNFGDLQYFYASVYEASLKKSLHNCTVFAQLST